MKCIKCSKETNNENNVCDKCLAKEKVAQTKLEIRQSKKELKLAMKELKKAKFKKIEGEAEPCYGKQVIATGLRSSIISLSSAITGILTSGLLLPGIIFGFLGLVEGIIALVDIIRNNRRGHRRMLPLAFAIIGILGSAIALCLAVFFLLSVIVYLLGGFAFGLVSIIIALLAAL